MKNIFKVLVVVSIVFIVTGCFSADTIVGTWNQYRDNNENTNIYYTFNKNNTGSYINNGISRDFVYEDRGNKIVITYNDENEPKEIDYTIEQDILTIKNSSGFTETFIRK